MTATSRIRRFPARRRVRSSSFAAEHLEKRTLLAAVTQAIQIDGQAPNVLGRHGDIQLLALQDADSTRLFSTDGSQAGTVELADLPGTVDSSDIAGTLGDQVLFRASENDTFWITDGTALGTVRLATIVLPTDLSAGAEFHGEFFFSADGGDGFELWKTDGTAAGTVQVKDINTGQAGPSGQVLFWNPVPNAVSYSVRIDAYTDCQFQAGNLECRQTTVESHQDITDTQVEVATTSELMFLFAHFADGSRSDAMALRNGTEPIDDVSGHPGEFAIYNGELYFAASTRDTGREIWKTDGTTAGTALAIDVVSGPASTAPQNFLEFDNQLFFGSYGNNSLYRTDGSTAGTTHVLTGDGVTRTGVAGSFPIAVVNNRLVAQQMGDGVSTGLRRLVSFGSATDSTPTDLGVQGSGDGRTATELWFDGFLVLNDRLLFRRVNGDSGSSSAVASAGHLFSTDGTTAGQISNRLLWNEVHGPKHGVIDSLEEFGSVDGNRLYFTTELERGFLDGVPLRTAAYRTDGSTLTILSEDEAAVTQSGMVLPHTFRQYAVVNGQTYYLSETSPDGAGNPLQDLYRVNPSGEDFVLATGLRAGSMLELSDQLYLDLPTDDGSALFSVTEQAFVDPVKVTGGTGTQASGTPELTWASAGAGVRQYELYINPVGARSTASYRRSGLTSTSHRPSTDLADGQYEVWLRVHFEDGARSRWGGNGEILTVNTGQVPSATPPEITAPATAGSSRRPQISWTTISGAVRYELWVSTATDITPVIHETSLTTTSFVPTSDLPSGRYRIWVRAHRLNSQTKWTPAYRTEILHDTITITGGTGDQDTLTPAITWAEADNVARYDLYINETGVSTPAYRRTALTGGSHTLETALDPAKNYQVWIRAHFSDGSRTRWGTASALTVSDGAFLQLVPSLSVSNEVVSWDPVEGADRYQVWVNDFLPDGRMIHRGRQIKTTETSVVLTYPPARYRVWVRAIDASNNRTQWSNSVAFFITATSDERSGLTELKSSLVALARPEQDQSPNDSEVLAYTTTRTDRNARTNRTNNQTDTVIAQQEQQTASPADVSTLRKAPVSLRDIDRLMEQHDVFLRLADQYTLRSPHRKTST